MSSMDSLVGGSALKTLRSCDVGDSFFGSSKVDHFLIVEAAR